MRKRYEDIKEDNAYVHNGQDQARLIFLLHDGIVFYYAFTLSDGQYQGRGQGKQSSFYQWQNREVTFDEFQKLDVYTAQKSLARHIRQTLEAQNEDPSQSVFLTKLEEKLKGDD